MVVVRQDLVVVCPRRPWRNDKKNKKQREFVLFCFIFLFFFNFIFADLICSDLIVLSWVSSSLVIQGGKEEQQSMFDSIIEATFRF